MLVLHACMHACTHARTHARTHVCMYVCMYFKTILLSNQLTTNSLLSTNKNSSQFMFLSCFTTTWQQLLLHVLIMLYNHMATTSSTCSYHALQPHGNNFFYMFLSCFTTTWQQLLLHVLIMLYNHMATTSCTFSWREKIEWPEGWLHILL